MLVIIMARKFGRLLAMQCLPQMQMLLSAYKSDTEIESLSLQFHTQNGHTLAPTDSIGQKSRTHHFFQRPRALF